LKIHGESIVQNSEMIKEKDEKEDEKGKMKIDN
jgi:hypothetical protein